MTIPEFKNGNKCLILLIENFPLRMNRSYQYVGRQPSFLLRGPPGIPGRDGIPGSRGLNGRDGRDGGQGAQGK